MSDEGFRSYQRGLNGEPSDGTVEWYAGDSVRQKEDQKPGPGGKSFRWSPLLLILVIVGLWLGYRYGVVTSDGTPNTQRPAFFLMVFGIVGALLFGIMRNFFMTIVLVGLTAFVLPIGFGITLPQLLRYVLAVF